MENSHIKKLVLLHSNDLHGDFFEEAGNGDEEGKLLGGISRLSWYVQQVRAKESNVLYCVAGDMLQGSVLDFETKGVSTIHIMNFLDPDVVCVGNHEVDYGLAHLLYLEKVARFPIINANLYVRQTGKRLFESHKILTLGGMKILFIGLVTEDFLTAASQDDLVATYLTSEEAAAEVGKICEEHKADDMDLTVLLTHSGYLKDRELAALLDPAWGVDLIVGGHSHTFLEQVEPVNGIPIAQAGFGTNQVGRFDLEIDTAKNSIHSWRWTPVAINSDTAQRDEVLEKVVASYASRLGKEYEKLLVTLQRPLTHPSRTEETELGVFIADVLQQALGVDLMMLGSGSLRKKSLAKEVTLGELQEMLPFDDPLYSVRLSGAMIKRAIRHIFEKGGFLGISEFYQYSRGLAVTYDKAQNRVVDIRWQGMPLADEAVLDVGMAKYHMDHIGRFMDIPTEEVHRYRAPELVAPSSKVVMLEQLPKLAGAAPVLEGRIQMI